MPDFLRSIGKNIPSLILAFALSVAAWISAVTATDPMSEKIYPKTIPIELVGQNPDLVIVSDLPTSISLTLSAPSSIWDRLVNEQIPVRAVADLSGLGSGDHTVSVQVQIEIQPIKIVSFTPRNLSVSLEKLASREMEVNLVQRGELGVGFQAGNAEISQSSVMISGPESLVDRVVEVRATLDLNRVTENIDRTLTLQAMDASGLTVNGINISPDQVGVSIPVIQRGGYRNVVVKVVLKGQVANGYRVTNISVFPPAVTVFSSNPKLVEDLPGYVDTVPLDLEGVKDDLDLRLELNLPSGVSVVGEQTVGVQVGIASIEGSLKLTDMQVEIEGLDPDLSAQISPSVVDVFLSGPLPVLDALSVSDVRVVIDLAGELPGTYQRTPRVEVRIPDVKVESVLPASVEVVVIKGQTTATKTPGP